MPQISLPPRAVRRRPVPRGIDLTGPPLLSYGFRPFFLLAGLHALLAMALWIGALSGLWSVGGSEGPIAWHAHEMLFGYAAAALAGFVLTAVPNWTGRLPVSGLPLLLLCGLWLAGRVASLAPQLLGEAASAGLDMLFLFTLAFVVGREVVAGRNWQNLRVVAVISMLALLNAGFHLAVLTGGDPALILRASVALYVLLVCLIGGRIIPSFTRNYLAKRGEKRLPAPVSRFDHVALLLTLIAGAVWAVWPTGPATAALCAATAIIHAVRLGRWRGNATHREPLLLVLHLAYGFVPLGFAALVLSGLELLSTASALHLLTVGVIGLTTLAVMTRVSRAHTGRALTASPMTTLAYFCLGAAALARPLAELVPEQYHLILSASGVAWLAAYGLFVLEHGPMLVRASVTRTVAR